MIHSESANQLVEEIAALSNDELRLFMIRNAALHERLYETDHRNEASIHHLLAVISDEERGRKNGLEQNAGIEMDGPIEKGAIIDDVSQYLRDQGDC